MKELVGPRFIAPRAERFADKVGFVDVTNDGVRYEGTFGAHLDRVYRLGAAMPRGEAGEVCARAGT